MVPYVYVVVVVNVLLVCLLGVKVRGGRQCWCGEWMRCGESRACAWYVLKVLCLAQ